MNKRFFFLAFCLLNIRSVAVGVPEYTGGEPGFWDDRTCLLARVEKASRVEGKRLEWQFTLQPLAVLRGDADLLKKASVVIGATIDPGSNLRQSSAITSVPEVHSCIALVIYHDKHINTLFIEWSRLRFMPDDCGIAPVKGDVLEFLEKIRTAILKPPPPRSPFYQP
jgi:hypothetical protein